MALEEVITPIQKPTSGRTIKYTVEYHRKEGVSKEDFMRWFTSHFLPGVIPILQSHGIMKYTLQKTDLDVRALPGGGWKVNDCDIVLEYWLSDSKSVKTLSSVPKWVSATLEGGDDWLDTSRSTVRIGFDEITYLEYGSLKNGAAYKRRSRVSAGFE
ncbi:hypothetical protein BJY04DRAFT_224057 [Aspergillus karnatakaensis]|uniref:uncharacterized protein n=1 Tax=Aspergillus karnatakaensis TaxID=1810916 RepID=UPI003CCCBAD8